MWQKIVVASVALLCVGNAEAIQRICQNVSVCAASTCEVQRICWLEDSGGDGFGGGGNGTVPGTPNYDPSINGIKMTLDSSTIVYVSLSGKAVYTTSLNCGVEKELRQRAAQAALSVKPLMPRLSRVTLDMFDEREVFTRVSLSGSLQFVSPDGSCVAK